MSTSKFQDKLRRRFRSENAATNDLEVDLDVIPQTEAPGEIVATNETAPDVTHQVAAGEAPEVVVAPEEDDLATEAPIG
ncbi:Hypothetical protein FKW44_008946, partial [Caligus rogercresseyi]